jgi:hypothetical protein
MLFFPNEHTIFWGHVKTGFWAKIAHVAKYGAKQKHHISQDKQLGLLTRTITFSR